TRHDEQPLVRAAMAIVRATFAVARRNDHLRGLHLAHVERDTKSLAELQCLVTHGASVATLVCDGVRWRAMARQAAVRAVNARCRRHVAWPRLCSRRVPQRGTRMNQNTQSDLGKLLLRIAL